MKHIRLLPILLIQMILFLCVPAMYGQQGTKYQYFATVVSRWNGEETVKRAYVTRVFSYPGWEACGKTEYHSFFEAAKEAFDTYLPNQFHLVRQVTQTRSLTIVSGANGGFKSEAEAKRSLDTWVAEQRRQEYRVVLTGFSFSCRDLH